MNAGLSAAIIALIGVITTAVIGYLVARRQSSGKIATTEAEQLWKESNSLLNRYKSDLIEARAETTALREEIRTLRTETSSLQLQTNALQATIAKIRQESEAEVLKFHEETETLTKELEQWRQEALTLRDK